MPHSNKFFLLILSFFIESWLFPNFSTAKSLLLEQKIERKLQQMTLDQKIGQLFMFGFPQNKLTPELKKQLLRDQPGSFVIFRRNISSFESIKKLNQDLYALSLEYSGLPPLIAVDQEGGNVVRITTDPPMPNALSLGQTKSPEIAEAFGRESADLLRDLGFNMNLAPVLDIADPLKFSFIGTRSYGDDPIVVGKIGFHFSRGLLKRGVVPTGKHFPGTGNTLRDPHHGVVSNSDSLENIQTKHLPPFQEFSKLGFFSALMLSHSSYPSLDPTNASAVFSKAIIQDLLRKKMMYRGLVITDDLQMSASKSVLLPEEAALQSLKAGSDVIMLTWASMLQNKAIHRVKTAVNNGEISVADIDQKLMRILKIKHYLQPTRVNSRNLAAHSLSSQKMQEIDDLILSKNLESNAAAERPGRICLYSSSTDFSKSFKSGSNFKFSEVRISKTTKARDLLLHYSKKSCDLVVFTVIGKRTAQLLKSLPHDMKKRSLVVNMSLPGLIGNEKNYQQLVSLYFTHKNAGKKIAQLLTKSYAINESQSFEN